MSSDVSSVPSADRQYRRRPLGQPLDSLMMPLQCARLNGRNVGAALGVPKRRLTLWAQDQRSTQTPSGGLRHRVGHREHIERRH